MALTTKQVKAVGAILALNFMELEEQKELQKEHKRKWWVKPFLAKRLKYDIQCTLLTDLLLGDSKDVTNFLRMTHEQFEELHEKIRGNITKKDTHCRPAISSEVKFAVTLRYLATGDSYKSLQFLSRISPATLSLFIPEVLKAVYNSMVQEYMSFPQNATEWLNISKAFEEIWQFPHTVGALDGKHIRIKKQPDNEGSMFYNYKGFHSIVLLALVDAYCRFRYINVGCNGRASDAGVFQTSYLNKCIKDKTINLPDNDALPMTNTVCPYFVISDDAFALDMHLMKPYSRSGYLTEEQKIFNYRICRARMVVEVAFGRLAGRFRIFHRPIEVKLNTVDWIVKTACVLHNYLTKEVSTTRFIDTLHTEERPFDFMGISGQTNEKPYRFACRIRDTLSQYFVTTGNVPFQWNKI